MTWTDSVSSVLKVISEPFKDDRVDSVTVHFRDEDSLPDCRVVFRSDLAGPYVKVDAERWCSYCTVLSVDFFTGHESEVNIRFDESGARLRFPSFATAGREEQQARDWASGLVSYNLFLSNL